MGCPLATGAAAAGPSFAFYRDSYGGSLDAASFSEAMPAAERCVRELVGGGYAIGDFKVTNYMEKGTTGLEVARSAALSELAGTGLAFAGTGRP